MSDVSLDAIDRDGALAEALDGLVGSRAALLRRAALGAGTLLAWNVSFQGEAEGAARGDIAILRYDLVLEYLQAGMYTEADRLQALSERTLSWARVVGAHERAHVAALRDLLGRRAIPSPTFDYRGVTEDEDAFTRTAVAFEDLTAAVLKSQALRLRSRPLVAALMGLHSVEARHAAWVRRRVGLSPVFGALDRPVSQARVTALVRSTRFVVSRPRTRSRRAPRFTG